MRLARGRYEAGLEALKEAAQLTPEWALELETLYAGLPFRSPEPAELKVLGASLQGWDAGQAPSSTNFVLFAHNGFHRHLRLYLLGLTSVWAGDPERAGQYASELRRSSRTAERSVITAAWAQSIRARVAVAQDRPSEAVDLLTMYRPDIPLELISISPFFSASMDRYELARLLEELDRPDEALAWYRSLTEGHELVLVAPGHLGMARILEARGDRVGAAEHYRRFADLWQDCEPQLRVLVEDARERAVRLGDGL